MFWLAIAPAAGLAGFIMVARLLKRCWLPDASPPVIVVLSSVITMTAWLAPFHLVAFGRMAGVLSGLSVPLISLGFIAALVVSGLLLRKYGSAPLTAVPIRPANHKSGRRRWRVLVLLLPVILAHMLLLAEGVSRMPSGHDGLKYRLPLVVSWLRTDSLDMRPEIWLFSLPGNGELVLWWLLKGGFERLASVAYFPLGLLLGAVAWTIVRIQHGSRFAATLAVVILLSTHMIAYQMYHAYIDLFGTTFLACAVVAFLLAAGKERVPGRRRMLIIVAGLAIGIALGTKPVNWVYALLISALFFGIQVARMRRHADLAFVLPVFAMACLACSGFWFVRAAVHTGNPFYPVQVAVGDHVLLKGVQFDTHYEIYEANDRPLTAMLSSPSCWHDLAGRLLKYAATLNMIAGGVGPLYTMYVPLGILLASLLLIMRGRKAARHHRLVVGVLTAIAFCIWVGPLCHYARFGMIYLVLGTCMAAPVIGQVARHWPRIIGPATWCAAFLACATLVAVPVRKLANRVNSGDLSRSAYYGMPSVIDQWPAGTRVINLSEWPGAGSLTYPLCGTGLKNEVIDYMTTKLLFPNMKPSVEDLQRLGIQYVVLRKPFRVDWPTDPRLKLVYDDSRMPRTPDDARASRIYHVPPVDADLPERMAAVDQPCR